MAKAAKKQPTFVTRRLRYGRSAPATARLYTFFMATRRTCAIGAPIPAQRCADMKMMRWHLGYRPRNHVPCCGLSGSKEISSSGRDDQLYIIAANCARSASKSAG